MSQPVLSHAEAVCFENLAEFSGKCFSISAQHDQGINWLVDRVYLQGLDTPLICWMMPPVLFDGTANGRQLFCFKEWLGEQMSLTFTDPISTSLLCCSPHHSTSWRFWDTEGWHKGFSLSIFITFLDLAKELNLILWDFWLKFLSQLGSVFISALS